MPSGKYSSRRYFYLAFRLVRLMLILDGTANLMRRYQVSRPGLSDKPNASTATKHEDTNTRKRGTSTRTTGKQEGYSSRITPGIASVAKVLRIKRADPNRSDVLTWSINVTATPGASGLPPHYADLFREENRLWPW